MKKIISIALLILYVGSMCVTASAAYGKDDIMGDPGDSLADVSPQVKWLTGSVKGVFILAGVLGIFAGGIYFFYGSMINKSEAKGQGISGIIGSIGVAMLVTIGITLLFVVVNKFL